MCECVICQVVLFVDECLNGEDGFGVIYLVMVNLVMMYVVFGYVEDYLNCVIVCKLVEKLFVVYDDEVYCQLCLLLVWDMLFVVYVLFEIGDVCVQEVVLCGFEWLCLLQIFDVCGDWILCCLNVWFGGWVFQYVNVYYLDVDDMVVVVMVMDCV